MLALYFGGQSGPRVSWTSLRVRGEDGAPEANDVECDHRCEALDHYHVDMDGYFDDPNGVGAEEEYDGDE